MPGEIGIGDAGGRGGAEWGNGGFGHGWFVGPGRGESGGGRGSGMAPHLAEDLRDRWVWFGSKLSLVSQFDENGMFKIAHPGRRGIREQRAAGKGGERRLGWVSL